VIFAPKREWCRATVIALSLPALFIVCVAMFLAGAIQSGHIGYLQVASQVIFIFLAFYHILPFLFTSYEIADSELILRVGLHPLKIPLKDIFAVESTRGQWGMPAWSDDALKIRYHRNRVVGDYVVISPLDKRAFLAELERRAPALQPAIVGNQRPVAAL
jgi:hypothetical protein